MSYNEPRKLDKKLSGFILIIPRLPAQYERDIQHMNKAFAKHLIKERVRQKYRTLSIMR